MENFRLYKREKLCSHAAIDAMFAAGNGLIAYPLRAVYCWREPLCGAAQARFMITIPKKKIRTAVGRVALRRRVREAYRLNRPLLLPALQQAGRQLDVAFIYLSSSPKPYAVIQEKMQEILTKIAAEACQP